MGAAAIGSALAGALDLALGLAWRGSVALLVALLLLLVMGRRASAASRHLVLCVTAAALLAQPVLLALLPPAAVPATVLSGAPENDAGPLVDSTTSGRAGALATASHTVTAWARQLGAPAAEGARKESGWGAREVAGGGALLVWILAFGRLLLGALLARRMSRWASPAVDERLGEEAAQTSRRLGNAVPFRLRLGPAGVTPLCTGALSPTIILPADFAAWSAERRRLVLLHEVAHVARRDCLLQLLVSTATALHAWNPLAHWMARAARLERETAADDLVAAAGLRASDHAAELLAMARGLLEAPRQLLSGAALVPMLDGPAEMVASPRRRRSALERRIRHILASDVRRDRPRRLFAWLGVLAAAAALVPLSRRAPEAQAASTVRRVSPAASRSLGTLRAAVATYLQSSDAAALRLALDPQAQSAVEEALDGIDARHHPAAAGIVVLDPATGEVRAMGGRTGGRSDPGLPARTAFEPASTIKVLLAAAALDADKICTDQLFDCRDGSIRVGDRGLHDATPHGSLSFGDILVFSSNVGAARILEACGDDTFARTLTRLHLDAAPPVEMIGAASGLLPSPSDWTHARALAASCGQGLTLSQLQMAAAFTAVANGGLYRAPSLLASGGGTPERVFREETATTLRGILEGVVQRDDGTGVAARVAGYRVAGKTGTGDGYATFVGAIPAEQPRAVILVGAATPGVMKTGGEVAAPAFAQVAARLMAAWEVPPSTCTRPQR